MHYHAEGFVFYEVRSICDLVAESVSVSVCRRRSRFGLRPGMACMAALEGRHPCVDGMTPFWSVQGLATDAVED